MPKNAVQRLQKIENDIKTVISIYDVAKKSKDRNDKLKNPEKENISQFRQTSTSKYLESVKHPDELQPSLFNSKNTGSFCIQPLENNHLCEPVLMSKKWKLKKPGSAPSSCSTLSSICESDYIRQQSSDSPNATLEKGALPKTKTPENLNSLIQFDPIDFSMHEVLMTPSKTLEIAQKILAKNNYRSNEESREGNEPLPCESVLYFDAKDTEDCSSSEKEEPNNVLKEKNVDISKKNLTFSMKNPNEELENSNAIYRRSQSVSQRKNSLLQKESPKWLIPGTTMVFAKTKPSVDLKKEQSPTGNLTRSHAIPTKVPKLEGQRSSTSESKNNIKFRSEIRNAQEKTKNLENCKVEKDDLSMRRGCEATTEDNEYSVEVKSNYPEKSSLTAKQEVFITDNLEKKKIKDDEKNKVQLSSSSTSICKDQEKVGKSARYEDEELWLNKLAKIIKRSNEKLEKMKVSKEMALDIAKHLKDKYEEIQQSKNKLTETMQQVQKENERLNNEIRDLEETKMKLQLKIEELQHSKNILTEQDIKTKGIIEENFWLKTRMCELQKQRNEELFEKQKEIEKIQRERVAELRNELKTRSNQAADIERLTNEKSELLAKSEELHCLLKDRHSRVEMLERKICQLEEEVQKQNQLLARKTERLEETNKELELIRQNSNNLEEQVKTLRKNTDNLEEMQQTLMKQTAKYEQQLKLNQDEMKKLQEENLSLKTELENERDAILIKAKIIEDQQETIKQLREKSEEVKTLLKKNQSLERVLNIEREEKLELEEAVERLKWRKEELKKKIKSLEGDLLLAPQEVIQDLKKTQIVLRELENQVEIKQKEWKRQMQSLITEKDQACSAAEFATKKLMQTTNEFQKQSEAYKNLHRLLAENLVQRERNLRQPDGKVINSTIKRNVTSVQLGNKLSGSPKDQHQFILNSKDFLMDRYPNNISFCYEEPRPRSSLNFF